MNTSSSKFPEKPEIERAAANWTLRLDRGITAEEQDEYSQWLSEDPRHRDAIALYRWGWDEFDRLAGLQTTEHAKVDPDLLAPGNRFVRKSRLLKFCFAAVPLAAAIAIMAVVFWSNPAEERSVFASKAAIELIARLEQKTLEDGSVIEFNRGAVAEVEYRADARLVRLIHGEANFTVATEPNRPFIVTVAGIDVRAVGTQFNVRLTDDAVDVIVSEGIVRLATSQNFASGSDVLEELILEVGHRAVVKLGETPMIERSILSSAELDRELGWQPRMLDFDDTPMSEIVSQFNKRNQVQLTLGDSSLEKIRFSNYFWSDNVEGFVRLMESNFDMRAEWRGSNEIVLLEAR